MTRKLLVLVGTVAVLSLPDGVSAQGFRGRGGFGGALFDRFDQNGDGVITSDEVPERATRFLDRTGLDFSRGVSRADFEQAMSNRLGGQGRASRGGDSRSNSQRGRGDSDSSESGDRGDRFSRFRSRFGGRPFGRRGDDAQARAQRDLLRFDANRDGVLANQEIPDAMRQQFTGFDTDRNGEINAEELAAGYSRPAGSPATGQITNPFTTGPRYPAGLPSWFEQSDRNQDGQVAMYEWDRQRLSEFEQYDQNSDGFIIADEALRSTGRSNTDFASVGSRGGFGPGGFGFGRGGFGGRPGGFGGRTGGFFGRNSGNGRFDGRFGGRFTQGRNSGRTFRQPAGGQDSRRGFRRSGSGGFF